MYEPIATYIRLQNGASVKAISRLHTHGRLSLLCSLTDLKFPRFQGVKNKARDIRLFHIWCPTTPKQRFPSAFPSGFYAAFGVKTVLIYHFFCYLQILLALFFKKNKKMIKTSIPKPIFRHLRGGETTILSRISIRVRKNSLRSEYKQILTSEPAFSASGKPLRGV